MKFDDLPLSMDWAFRNADTRYLTHDIHRYPAKFIPQLARRLITEYSEPGDVVLDPFCGSGTALLEARLAGRNAVGVDLNPVAWLVSKVKTRPIEPTRLSAALASLREDMERLGVAEPYPLPDDALRVLRRWVPPRQLDDMRRLFTLIMGVEDSDVREFLLVAFSHIQKTCSWWLMRSVKPIRDRSKKVPPVAAAFTRHVAYMEAKNRELWEALRGTDTWVKVYKGDARRLSEMLDVEADLIVFSPPYVTSYEYVDVHKLSIVWLERTGALREIRRGFIGSASAPPRNRRLRSPTAARIVGELGYRDRRLAQAVQAYFADMEDSFSEMDRVLRPGGHVAIVIGNTRLRGVDILNAEVFAEVFVDMGYSLVKTVKRPVLGKNLPSARDPATGRFTSARDSPKAYPHEYILVLRKPG